MHRLGSRLPFASLQCNFSTGKASVWMLVGFLFPCTKWFRILATGNTTVLDPGWILLRCRTALVRDQSASNDLGSAGSDCASTSGLSNCVPGIGCCNCGALSKFFLVNIRSYALVRQAVGTCAMHGAQPCTQQLIPTLPQYRSVPTQD